VKSILPKRPRGMGQTDLAVGFARAMNLLNHLRSSAEAGEFAVSDENEFCFLAKMLPETERESFWNNGTLRGSDLLRPAKY
jgi:hypothetical protein